MINGVEFYSVLSLYVTLIHYPCNTLHCVVCVTESGLGLESGLESIFAGLGLGLGLELKGLGLGYGLGLSLIHI